jgi:anaerobic magnesium-protoporphyrin IX monomethyl ester cyclase
MKIVFIHAELKNYDQPKLPPLGILSIAACLEKEGHTVRIIDLNASGENFHEKMVEGADIVGITATTPLIKEAWRIMKMIRSKNIPVILGGPHPSALPEESLREGADIVVRGEGEKTLEELLEKWPNLEGIKGISYIKDGKIVHEDARPLLQDLDLLPFPAFHLLENIEKYTTPQPVLTKPMKTLTIITSRGCPYNCTYCYKGVFGRTWRAHSAEYVANLWQHLYEKYKVEMVGVEDDNFNMDPERVKEICRLLKKKNVKTLWTTAQGLRADRIDKELLFQMKDTGFMRTGFGIEAGSQEMIDKIDKSLDLKKVKEAIRFCRELGIESIGYFMLGNYGETKKTMEQTIRLACELDPDIAHFTIAVPLPGSPLYKIIEKDGKFIIKDWSLYGYTRGRCFFEIGELKKDLVEKMWKKAYRRFYLRPKVIFRFLTKKNTWLVFPTFLKAGLSYLGITKN